MQEKGSTDYGACGGCNYEIHKNYLAYFLPNHNRLPNGCWKSCIMMWIMLET